jgi:hypothetical protein
LKVRVFHKAAYSLIISALLAAGFAVSAYTGLFDLVETRFYNPVVTRAVRREVAADADIIQELLTKPREDRDQFAAPLTVEAVRLVLGEDAAIIPEPAGIVSGLPSLGRDPLLPLIAKIWRDGDRELTALDLVGADAALYLVSAKTDQGIYIGRLVPDRLLALSPAMRPLLLAVFFITTCITVFLLFSIRRDPVAVVQNRLRRLRESLINDSRGEDRDRWSRELERRREDVRAEIKRGIRLNGMRERDIDNEIDRSWSEMVAIIGAVPQYTAVDEAEAANQALTDAGNRVTWDLEELKGIEESELAEEVETVNDDEPRDEAELLEELEPADGAAEIAAFNVAGEGEDGPSISENDIATLTSRIEFSPLPEDDTPAGDIPELEIVSPFDTLLSDLPPREYDDFEPDGSDEKKNAKLNSPEDFQTADLEFLDAGYQMSLVYSLFAVELSGNPPDLAPVPEGIIESRNGIAYINTAALGSPKTAAQSLNPEFKDLVDSVLRKVLG